MRLALKSTLAFLVLYLAVVGGVAWWMATQLHALARNMAENTAQMVGGEVARALTASAVEQLQRADDATLSRLQRIVDDVTQHSSILTAVAVVDHGGRVIAGDNVEIGRQVALPAVVFNDETSVRLLSEDGPFGGGLFYLMVPLKSGKELAGYLRLEMRSQRIANLYTRAARNLMLVALAGLVSVGLAGVLLHVQISHQSEALARALEGAVRGEAAGPREGRDEFSRAIAVARKVGRELTEARGERQQVQHRIGALMKALDTGVLVLENDLRLGFANGRAAELLGHGDTGELARRWDDIRALLEAIPPQLSGAPAGRRAELELAARDGAPRLKLEFYELGEGSCDGFLVLVKNAESIELLQNELGLAMQMRGLTRFYSAFAHDLRAPLNAMVMTLELLKISVERNTTAPVADAATGDDGALQKQLKYVGTLNEEIRRLDRQLHTLLSHTAPPSEGRHEVDLCVLLQNLDALLSPQAKRQRVTMATRVPDEPLVVVGQSDRLKQALLNIVINALEAMPDGGELAMMLERCDHAARLTVKDSGPGIAPEVLDTIYEMHFTTKSGGTGVGLYVARTVVQAHGGTIEVHSAPGAGTSFVLTLPL